MIEKRIRLNTLNYRSNSKYELTNEFLFITIDQLNKAIITSKTFELENSYNDRKNKNSIIEGYNLRLDGYFYHVEHDSIFNEISDQW